MSVLSIIIPRRVSEKNICQSFSSSNEFLFYFVKKISDMKALAGHGFTTGAFIKIMLIVPLRGQKSEKSSI